MASSIRAVQGGADLDLEEINNSPQVSASREARNVTREFKFPWANGDALIAQCFPSPPSNPGAYPGVAYLFCDSLEIVPFHPEPGEEQTVNGSGVSEFTYAHATLTYAPLPYDYNDTDLLSRRYSIGGEVMTYPSRSIRWNGETKPVKGEGIQAGKIIPSIEHSITRHRATAAQVISKYATIRSLIGKVNSSVFDPANAAAAVESALFMGAEISFKITTLGDMSFEVEMRFQERLAKQGSQSVGWNHFWREDAAGGAKWEELETTKGEPIYPSDNLNSLLSW